MYCYITYSPQTCHTSAFFLALYHCKTFPLEPEQTRHLVSSALLEKEIRFPRELCCFNVYRISNLSSFLDSCYVHIFLPLKWIRLLNTTNKLVTGARGGIIPVYVARPLSAFQRALALQQAKHTTPGSPPLCRSVISWVWLAHVMCSTHNARRHEMKYK